MSAARTLALINNWATTRYELLNTRICDLNLAIEGSPVEPFVARIRRELLAKGLRFAPEFYLSDSWGCPNEVPVVGIPFYLADRRLSRLEEEQTGEIEDPGMILMFLRHEVGHAVNYAYRLWKNPEWAAVFGSFTKPYRDSFRPNPQSRRFVQHLFHSQHGRNYAQKHPDEDFAETFAVWLTPRSGWRRRYRGWPAIHKLRYVHVLMRSIRRRRPRRASGRLLNPVQRMDILLADHYGQRAERFRAQAQGYVDDRLRSIFAPVSSRALVPAADLIRRCRPHLLGLIERWSDLQTDEIEGILGKIEDRAIALQLAFRRRDMSEKVIDISTLATSLAMDFAYTGRFMG